MNKIIRYIGKTATKIANACTPLPSSSVWGGRDNFDRLPPEAVRAAMSLPFAKERLVEFSINEYNCNPYYALVINNLGDHTIGPSPGIIATSSRVDDRDNDLVEDHYHAWTAANGIGQVFRNMRKEAAKTGLAIAIPYIKQNSLHPNPLTFKVYGFECLETPRSARPEDRIINGIEYDRDWEVVAFHIKDTDDTLNVGRFINDSTKEYRVEEVLWWSRNRVKGMVWPMPECYSAFTLYPFIQRYLQAVIEGEEFKASFPMAVELDPKVYSQYARDMSDVSPKGTFEYDTKTVPTLAPGMTLSGMPHSVGAKDQERTMQMFAATCALSVSMPKNLALGDSSNSNMASTQVDIQPWANKVKIDRFDMEPVFRQAFKWWWELSVRIEMPFTIRKKHLLMYPHYYVYPDLFEHPDPNKRASARALDLASGAETLNRLYANRGLNFRREMEREAKALGIPVQDLIEIIISSRSADALSVINEEAANQGEESSPQKARVG